MEQGARKLGARSKERGEREQGAWSREHQKRKAESLLEKLKSESRKLKTRRFSTFCFLLFSIFESAEQGAKR
jgi:hypothetical protein